MAIEISVDAHEITVGDLLTLADVARKQGLDPKENLGVKLVENETPPIPDRYFLEVTALPGPVTYIEADLRDRLLVALDRVVDAQGDARGAMGELEELRELLNRTS